MDFTNWRFSSPSSCEYQPLEVDFSPTMKQPSSESIMASRWIYYLYSKTKIRRIGQ
ncbi:BnaC02g20350D [Brassica napus]|uniref:BnaC02g20350D protein n=1 Tax=Brassica napus TaxID=3708 RepID=A0A078FC00_BRANA|nr:BnaC02g20350D [Brassica napus]